MEELKRVQELRVDESSRRRLIESQDTVNELTASIQELDDEGNGLNLNLELNLFLHVVVIGVEILSLNSQARFRNYRMKLIV